ncbi:hypothetical protein ABZ442_05115 [Streptomyces triculaminicus]|uniref:hypothetical protein n=1 Tax=Streptomyces triculaminicus TaxID=2816232 RepID=UPI0033DF0F33
MKRSTAPAAAVLLLLAATLTACSDAPDGCTPVPVDLTAATRKAAPAARPISKPRTKPTRSAPKPSSKAKSRTRHDIDICED